MKKKIYNILLNSWILRQLVDAFKNTIILKYKCIIICISVFGSKICNIVFRHEIVHCYMSVFVSELSVVSVWPQLKSLSRIKIIIWK